MEVKEDMDTCGEQSKKDVIDISFCGSTPMLWKMSDIKSGRSAGVIGALVGSLARQPRQNVRLGRPLELMQEEALLLEETTNASALLLTRVSYSVCLSICISVCLKSLSVFLLMYTCPCS